MSAAPTPGALYRRAPHLAWRRVVEETVVLDLERRQVFGLSNEAGALLATLAEPRDLAELAARLAAADETPGATIARLTRTLGELADAGLVATTASVASDCVSAAQSPRAILWREQLEEVTQQTSPPMQIGNPQCLQ